MFDKDTKVTEILNKYPWLLEELAKIEPKVKALNNPIGKAMIKDWSVADAAKQVGASPEVLLGKLEKLVKEHK